MEQEIEKILSLLENKNLKNVKLALTLNKELNLIPILNSLGKQIENLKNSHFAANESRIITLTNSKHEIIALNQYYKILSQHNPLFQKKIDCFKFLANFHELSFKVLPYKIMEFINDLNGRYYYQMDIDIDVFHDYDDLFEDDEVYGSDWERVFEFILKNQWPSLKKYFKYEDDEFYIGCYEGGGDFFYARTQNLDAFNKILNSFDKICVDLGQLPSLLKRNIT